MAEQTKHMNILLQDYLSERLQAHFDGLQLPQTDTLLEHKVLTDALHAKGALQEEQSPEETNIFRWPWSLKGNDSDPLFLKHCCLRFFYTFAASVYGVNVTQVRQAISRKRNGFTEECAFHLTYKEHKDWYKKDKYWYHRNHFGKDSV